MTKEEVAQYSFTHSLDIQIRFTDLDINGHVNNGIFHSYFDLGRANYFLSVFQARTGNTLIAQVNTTYVQPLLIQDKICIKSSVVRWGNSSFDMLQAVFKQVDDSQQLICFNMTTFVHLDNGRPSPIPQTWKDAVKAFEKGNLLI